MKKLLLILFIILVATIGYSQSVTQRTTGSTTVSDGRLMAAFNLFIPRYNDTTSASAAKGIDTCGAIIFTYDSGFVWVRRCNPAKYWSKIGNDGSGTVTAASNGLSLSSSTTVLGGSTITQYTPITLGTYPIQIIHDGITNALQTDSNSLLLINKTVSTSNLDSLATPGIVFSTSADQVLGSAKTVRFRIYEHGYGNALGALVIGTNTDAGVTTPLIRLSSAGYFIDNLNIQFHQIGGAGTGTSSIRFGTNSLNYLNNSSVTGGFNIAIGYETMYNNTTGFANTAMGYQALKANTGGDENTAIGFNALFTNDSIYNTAVGAYALYGNTTGQQNTAVGKNALLDNTTGQKNSAFGAGAGEETTTGSFNTFIGQDAGLHNTIGDYNAAIGWLSWSQNITGHENVGLGVSTGRSVVNGYHNIAVGNEAMYLDLAGMNVQEDTVTNSIAIGAHSYTTASNQMRLGNDSLTSTYIYGVAEANATKSLLYNATTKQVYYGNQLAYYVYPLTAPNDSTLAIDTGAGRSAVKTWLTSAHYVDSVVALATGTIFEAYNGVTDSSGRVILGGSLYKNTTINTQSYTLTVSNSAGVIPLEVSSVGAVAIYAHATGASGVYGQTDDTYGVLGGATTNGQGVRGTSASGIGVAAQSDDGVAIQGTILPASTNTTANVLVLHRATTGTAADGIGGIIQNEVATTTGANRMATQLVSKWTVAADATRTSQFDIMGVNSAATETYMNIQTGGIVRVNNLADTLSTKAYARSVGGAGGSAFLPTTGTGTATGAIIGSLAGNTLNIQQGGTSFISINPTAGSESSTIQSFNTTGGGNTGAFTAQTTATAVSAIISSDFNSSTKSASVRTEADNTYGKVSLIADSAYFKTTLAGSVIGYIPYLDDVATGRWHWAVNSAAVAWNGITDPTGDQALIFDAGESSTWTNSNTTEDLFTINSSTLTSGSFFSLNSTSTALAAGNNLAEFIMSGANATASITATALTATVTNTGPTNINIAFAPTASGAATANYSIKTGGGALAIGSPTYDANHALLVQSFTNTNSDGIKIYPLNNSTSMTIGYAKLKYAGQYSFEGNGGLLFLGSASATRGTMAAAGQWFFGGATTPTAWVHLAAGTTAVSTAPLKFTSGSLQTTAEAGAVEFLTDKWYATITTGAARKEITLNDAALTSGVTPVATTNGRLTDGLTISASTYAPTLTIITNLDGATVSNAQYMRVGDVVTVSGKITANPTATGATSFRITLPIASAFSTTEQCGGVAFAKGIAGLGAEIYADTANDEAKFEWVAADVSDQEMAFTYTYIIAIP